MVSVCVEQVALDYFLTQGMEEGEWGREGMIRSGAGEEFIHSLHLHPCQSEE